MLVPHRATGFALIILMCGATSLNAAEPIGKAVEIKTAVTGAGGDFSINDPVHQDERIRTSQSGLGEFAFRDGTKLAVGWGSSVVVDKFVYDGSNSVKKLTVKAAKGTFRWVSGRSKHTAYEIVTPAGTIGVRGTVFDFYIGRDGTTAVVLLGGAASFCGPGGCRQLTKRCDCIVAKRNGNMTDVRRVNRTVFKTLGNARALPFLSGNQKLGGSIGYGGCGLTASVDVQHDDRPQRREPQARPTPNVPDRIEQPEQQKPDDPKPGDNKPDPGKPDHEKPDHEKPGHEKPDHQKPDHDRPDGPDDGKPDRGPGKGHGHHGGKHDGEPQGDDKGSGWHGDSGRPDGDRNGDGMHDRRNRDGGGEDHGSSEDGNDSAD